MKLLISDFLCNFQRGSAVLIFFSSLLNGMNGMVNGGRGRLRIKCMEKLEKLVRGGTTCGQSIGVTRVRRRRMTMVAYLLKNMGQHLGKHVIGKPYLNIQIAVFRVGHTIATSIV